MTTFDTQKGKLSYLYNKIEKNKFDIERLDKMEVVKKSITFNKNRQEIVLADKVLDSINFEYRFDELEEKYIHWVKPLFLFTPVTGTMSSEEYLLFIYDPNTGLTGWNCNYYWIKTSQKDETKGMKLIGSCYSWVSPIFITIKLQIINPQLFEGFRGKQ